MIRFMTSIYGWMSRLLSQPEWHQHIGTKRTLYSDSNFIEGQGCNLLPEVGRCEELLEVKQVTGHAALVAFFSGRTFFLRCANGYWRYFRV